MIIRNLTKEENDNIINIQCKIVDQKDIVSMLF